MSLRPRIAQVFMNPRWIPADDPRNLIAATGADGWYRVTSVLELPGSHEVPVAPFASVDTLEGRSFLRVIEDPCADRAAETALAFDLSTGGAPIRFTGYLNARGYLGKIVAHRVYAGSSENAERKTLDALVPWLNRVALTFDVPVEIGVIQITELQTGTHRLTWKRPPKEGSLQLARTENGTAEWRYYAALYREALNSNSIFYTFLCLFKIVEALLARRRADDQRQLRIGRVPHRVRETLPSSQEAQSWLSDLFWQQTWQPQTVAEVFIDNVEGAPVKRVIDRHLRPVRRNIAHAVLDTGELTIALDDPAEHESVCRWIPLLKCIARHYLRTEFPDQFGMVNSGQPDLRIIAMSNAEPNDGIFESPTISQIRTTQAV